MTTSTDDGTEQRSETTAPVTVTEPDRPRRLPVVLLSLVVIGVALRAVAVWLFHARQIEGLTVSYVDTARNLLAGDPFVVERGVEIMHPMGYSTVIALVQSTGLGDLHSVWVVTVIQALLDTSAIVLLYLAGRNLHSHRTGLWVAAVYAINPMAVLTCVQPNPEALSPFLMAAVLAAISAIWRPGARWWPLWVGLACGVGANFRSEYLLLFVGVVVYVALVGLFRQDWRRLLAMIAVVAACMAPMAIGTWAETGTARVNTTNSAGTMWQGLGELRDNPWGLRLGDDYVVWEAERQGFSSAWGPEANAYFKDEVEQALKDHPGYYADLVLTRRIPMVFDTELIRWNYAQYAYGIFELENNKAEYWAVRAQVGPVQAVRVAPALVVFSPEFGTVMEGWAYASFAAAIAYLLVNRRRPRQWLLVWLPLTYFVLALCVLKFVEPRQFFVLIPLYTLALGGVIGWVHDRLTRTPAES